MKTLETIFLVLGCILGTIVLLKLWNNNYRHRMLWHRRKPKSEDEIKWDLAKKLLRDTALTNCNEFHLKENPLSDAQRLINLSASIDLVNDLLETDMY